MEQKFYKKLENGKPIGNLEVKSNIQYCNPGKNLDDAAVLVELGYWIYMHTPEPTDNFNMAKKYVSNDVEISDGVWKNSWSLEDVSLTEDQAAANKEQGWNRVRQIRTWYLQRTDHYGISDTPEMSEEMKEYRQKLRDLPTTTDDPFNVVYPTDPSDPDGTKY